MTKVATKFPAYFRFCTASVQRFFSVPHKSLNNDKPRLATKNWTNNCNYSKKSNTGKYRSNNSDIAWNVGMKVFSNAKLYRFVFFSLDKLKLKTKTKNQIILLLTFRLFYTFWIERTRKLFFPPLKKFKVYKKVVNFHLHQQKIFWFLSAM